MKRTMITMAALAASTLALAACGSAESIGGNASAEGSQSDSTTLVVGSQDYYSNEIIAEVYAQALEDAGYAVDRQMRIGQREVYMPEIESGTIDVFPEYTGNLLQYLDQNATARSTDEVYDALTTLLPQGLRALDQAPATDQDSYVVTTTFATEHSLSSIGDLAGAGPLTLGGNSELETRPYGPAGLAQTYGVSVNFTPIEDSGGPLTVKALTDGDIQLANIYSSDPVLADGSLTVLEDPQGLFLASHVVPLASSRVDDKRYQSGECCAGTLGPGRDEPRVYAGSEVGLADRARVADLQGPALLSPLLWTRPELRMHDHTPHPGLVD